MAKHKKNNGNAFTKSKWDPLHSTFAQRILFSNGNELTGYSKRMNFAEKKDKLGVICNMILRDYRYGYLDEQNRAKDPIEYIEFYHLEISRMDPPRMVRLYYNFFEFDFNYVNWKDGHFAHWLEKFYKMIEEKRSIDAMWNALYFKPRRTANEDPLSLNKVFTNAGHLANYCVWLIEKNIRPKGEVEHFYKKYMEKFKRP